MKYVLKTSQIFVVTQSKDTDEAVKCRETTKENPAIVLENNIVHFFLLIVSTGFLWF